MRRWLLVVLALFILEAIFIAPPELESTRTMVLKMLMFDLNGINLSVMALFYGVGFLVSLHGCYLMADRRRPWPHPLAAVFPAYLLGSFVLLPYYALRRHDGVGERQAWFGWTVLRAASLAGLFACMGLALWAGHPELFWVEFKTRWFTHVMAVDALVLIALLPLMAKGRI